MKDFFGEPIQIGDKVAAIRKNYRYLVEGVVTDFTPKQIRVEYTSFGSQESYLVRPNMLVKKPRK